MLGHVTTPWATQVSLHPQAPLPAIEDALRRAIVPLQADGGAGYAVDRHFEIYVLAGVGAIEDAERLLAALDAGARRRGAWSSSECAKAHAARSWLDGDRGAFWRASPDRIRTVLARARRVHCGCHCAGSFQPDRKSFYPREL